MKTGLKRTLREVAKPKRMAGAIRWFPCHLKRNPHRNCRVYVSRRNRKAKRPLVIHVRTLGQKGVNMNGDHWWDQWKEAQDRAIRQMRVHIKPLLTRLGQESALEYNRRNWRRMGGF